MDPDAIAAWLEAYGAAWIARDPRKAMELFAPDAIYQETPFSESLRGREAIGAYWAEIEHTQEQIEFGYEVLSVTPNMGIAQWWATFVRKATGAEVRIDGIALIGLDKQNLCVSFHEWWHRQETPPD